MPKAKNRYSIYDAMEARGVFELNPANADARDPVTNESTYAGPVQFPKMFYHPKGLERILVEAEIIETVMGPKRVGEQRELVWKIAQTASEAKELVASGWHDHPSKAIRARLEAEGRDVGEAPAMGSVERIESLEQQIARLQSELNDSRAAQLGPQRLVANPPKPERAAQIVPAQA